MIAEHDDLLCVSFDTLVPPTNRGWYCILPLELYEQGQLESTFKIGRCILAKAQDPLAPHFANVNAQALARHFEEIVKQENANCIRKTTLRKQMGNKYVYSHRSFFGLPDYMTIQFLNTPYGSTLAIYNVSKYGRNNSKNEKRVKHYLGLLQNKLASISNS